LCESNKSSNQNVSPPLLALKPSICSNMLYCTPKSWLHTNQKFGVSKIFFKEGCIKWTKIDSKYICCYIL